MMKYYMIKVIKLPYDRRWLFDTNINYAGRRYVRIGTYFGGIALVFSGGNAHYLREKTKDEQKMMEDYEHPKRKDGKLDMRYTRNHN